MGGKLTFVQQADKYFTYDFAAQAWSTAQAPDAIYRSPAGGAGCTTYEFQVESLGNSAYLFHQYRSVSGTPCTNLMGQFWQYTP
ncbi:hypothetical protein ACS5NO_05510 [Larkinella sp. GY13]